MIIQIGPWIWLWTDMNLGDVDLAHLIDAQCGENNNEEAFLFSAIFLIFVLKYGFCTSVKMNLWPVEHFCPPFFFPDQHGGQKCSTCQRFISIEVLLTKSIL